MPINLNDTSKKAVQALSAAFRDGNDAEVEQAVAGLRDSIAADVTEQYRDAIAANDSRVLAQRGFRQLTSAETAYYNGVIDALSSNNPKQSLTDFSAMPDKAMPTTVFEQVMKDIQLTHPLLAAIPVVTTGYITEWVKNKHSEQLAAWGNVGDAITKEITSAFEVIDIRQSKLSCFAVVSLDMLKLGPVWLDGYVRAVLGEAMACGLEHGIIDGSGAKGEPIGLDRDIHEGVNISSSTGYPPSRSPTSSPPPTALSSLSSRRLKRASRRPLTSALTEATSSSSALRPTTSPRSCPPPPSRTSTVST